MARIVYKEWIWEVLLQQSPDHCWSLLWLQILENFDSILAQTKKLKHSKNNDFDLSLSFHSAHKLENDVSGNRNLELFFLILLHFCLESIVDPLADI